MLWVRSTARRCEDIIGQDGHPADDGVRTQAYPMLIFGPHGTGKTTAVGCMTERLYGENREANTTVFSTADLLGKGKSVLESDDRFSHIYRKDLSMIANFKRIVKLYASMRPLDAEFKVMVFEDAEHLTFEAQQSLRRTMERYSATCRFVFVTVRPSAIIPAIASRCLPLFFPWMRRSSVPALRRYWPRRGERPKDDLDPDRLCRTRRPAAGYNLPADCSRVGGGGSTLRRLRGRRPATSLHRRLRLRGGNLEAARGIVESLLIDYGLSAQEAVVELREAIRRDYNHPALVIALADTDLRLTHSANDFVQLNALLARIALEVSGEEGTAAL